jgi:D-arabinose 1-dehydrogenase-like Zn-dependent alcohol dehydrogenase
MKAAVLTELNKPLEFQELADPEPSAGQVRIRMFASGICGTDLHAVHGFLPIQVPIVLGHEPVGVIDKLGPGVTKLKVGDRVGVSWVQDGCGRCAQCQRRKELYCQNSISWMNNGGGNSELMIAEAQGCTLLPDDLDWEIAAPLFCAGYTIMSGYRNGNPKPGERIAILGIGGLGHLALQTAKAMGHEVIAITGSENKRNEAKQLGADEVVVVKEHAGKELLAIGGADIVLSTSNSMQHNTEVIEGLRPEGRLVTMGVGGEPIQVSPFNTLLGQLTIKGSTQNERGDMVDILNLAAAGKVKPTLETYRLDEINSAFNRLEEGKVRYRAVVMHEV